MSNRFGILWYDEVPEELRDYNINDPWIDPFSCLVEYDTNGKIIRVVNSDGGEPEDQTFGRNWAWVVDEMNKLDEEIKNG